MARDPRIPAQRRRVNRLAAALGYGRVDLFASEDGGFLAGVFSAGIDRPERAPTVHRKTAFDALVLLGDRLEREAYRERERLQRAVARFRS